MVKINETIKNNVKNDILKISQTFDFETIKSEEEKYKKWILKEENHNDKVSIGLGFIEAIQELNLKLIFKQEKEKHDDFKKQIEIIEIFKEMFNFCYLK